MAKDENMGYIVDDYMAYCTHHGLRKKTVNSYESTLRLFLNWIEAERPDIKRWRDVTTDTIHDYTVSIQARGKYAVMQDRWALWHNNPGGRTDYRCKMSPVTINNYVRNISAFFSWLIEQHRAARNPVKKSSFLEAPKYKNEYIEMDDFRRLRGCLTEDRYAEHRDGVILDLLMDTGCRIGELLATESKNVDLTRRQIFLPAAITKGNSDRVVFFGQKMARELRSWAEYKDRWRDSDFLFCSERGNPLGVRTFESNLRKYGSRVGLRDVHPHAIRHSYAKNFLMNGGDLYTLSRIMGHSSVQVTEQIYLDITSDDLRRRYQKYSPMDNL